MGELLLSGLDGSTPLAFLAALGTLRVLDRTWPDRGVRLRWVEKAAWVPMLHVQGDATAEQVVAALDTALGNGAREPEPAPRRRGRAAAGEKSPTQLKREAGAALKRATKEAKDEGARHGLAGKKLKQFVDEQVSQVKATADRASEAARQAVGDGGRWPQFSLDDVIGVPVDVYRAFACRAIASAATARETGAPDWSHTDWPDFVASFASEAVHGKDGRVQPTPLSFLNGAGGKCLLKTCRDLAEAVTVGHLERSLFQPWRYQDEQLVLRWDPVDDRRYALRWSDPGSGAPGRTEWGASRLAVEALPLFPAAPVGRGRLGATGWRDGGDGPEFTWPIWSPSLSLDVVRSLVAQRHLEVEHPDRRALSRLGVVEVFRSRRVVVNKNVFFAAATPTIGS